MDVEVVCSRKGGIAVNGLKLIHHNIQKQISLTPEDGTPRRDSFTGVSPGNIVNEDEWFHEFIVSDSYNEQCSLSKFSPGDRVVLSRNDGLMVTGRATIEKVEINHNMLSLVTSRPLRVQSKEHISIQPSLPGSANLNELWRIDRDGAGRPLVVAGLQQRIKGRLKTAAVGLLHGFGQHLHGVVGEGAPDARAAVETLLIGLHVGLGRG